MLLMVLLPLAYLISAPVNLNAHRASEFKEVLTLKVPGDHFQAT